MPTLPINWILKNHISGAGAQSPVKLVITYAATQFDFKWKAPVGSTLTFNWGDGTTSDVSGNDATLVTTTSSYSGTGTYNFSITGDVLDLTWIDIEGQSFVSGTWTDWIFDNLTYLDVGDTGTDGDIEGYAALTSMTVLNVDSTTATGDAALLVGLTSLTSFSFNSTSVTWGANTTMSLTSATVNAASSGMSTSTQVDNFIDSFKASTGSTFNVAGTNAHRTAASNDDLNTLLANGNTITLNDVLGAELHTSLNAANDSATEAVTSFADYASTIDGATQVNSGADVLDMIPQGSEEVTNGDFASDLSGWTNPDAAWSWVGGEAVSDGTGSARLYQTALTNGLYYITTIDCTAYTSGTLDVRYKTLVGSALGQISATGTFTFAGRAEDVYFTLSTADSFIGTIDNVSVQELEVLGADLVTNGSFATDTDWNKGTGWTISGGTANCDGSQSGLTHLSQSMMTAGNDYIVKFTISNYSAGNILVQYGGSGDYSQYYTANGTYSFIGTSIGNAFLYFYGNADFIGSIDNVSVQKLTWGRQISDDSTNYSGFQFALPIDENSFAVPVDYVAESIVAQKFTGESNTTTGFTVANNALITSVTTPVNVGSFALNVESNSTPTADADCDIDFTVENTTVYRLSVDWRHIGTGDDWILQVEGVTAATRVVGNVTYVTKVYYYTTADTTTTVRFMESNIANDGGVVFDNLSLKKVTLS